MLEFHAEAPQATASEGFAQGPYVADRAGVEPTTLSTKGAESTNEPVVISYNIYVPDFKVLALTPQRKKSCGHG